MNIVKDTLEALIETWDDPGDYPSNAGAGPLPSYKYLAGLEGELVIELSPDELTLMRDTVREESLDEWMNQVVDYELPSQVSSVKWELISEVGGVVTLIVSNVEPNPDYGMEDYNYWMNEWL